MMMMTMTTTTTMMMAEMMVMMMMTMMIMKRARCASKAGDNSLRWTATPTLSFCRPLLLNPSLSE